MAATIFGDRFRGRGVPAWHKIGKTFEEDAELTAVEAFIDCGLNYGIQKLPLLAIPDPYAGFAQGGTWAPTATQNFLAVPGQYAIVREAIGDEPAKVLATVGEEFQPIQNMDLAELLDRSGLTDLYQVETLGALGDGETIFMALADRDGEFDIAGSPARNYWTLYDGKDGNRSLGLMNTPVKVVCSNTLTFGISEATINIKIQHSASARSQLEFWMGIAPQLKAAEAATRQIIQVMVEHEVTGSEVDRVLRAAYAAPATKGKAALAAVAGLELPEAARAQVDKAMESEQKNRLKLWERMELAREVFEDYPNSDDEKGQAGTLWGVYEAVCDVEDHREAKTKRENVAVSSLVGSRSLAKIAAMKESIAILR